MSIILLVVFGALGALTKEMIEDNKIKMPKIEGGELELGFIGSCFLGGIAGYIVDHSPMTAFAVGYTAHSFIKNTIATQTPQIAKVVKTVEQQIRDICKYRGFDADLAVRVAKAESSLCQKAVNINTDGSRDRGIFQINDKWHPEVSDEQAFDIDFSTNFFITAVNNGNLSWWNSSKSAWEIK